jgi:3' terminal RNA ribose 2'-O-methyltransferase Hen1
MTCLGKASLDFSYLLHKNPSKAHIFDMSFGRAIVFYPELSETISTCTLMLDIDPLAQGKADGKSPGLFDYVSPRPYSSSSFMSVAIANVFGSALGGRCSEKPNLADEKLDLSVSVAALPCYADKQLAWRLFEPLGYRVGLKTDILDEAFPDWGPSPYVDLELSGRLTLSTLLRQLYVLIPVFDRKKHYYVSEAEVDKLARFGEGWLSTHPAKEEIASRYLSNIRSLTRLALNRLENGESGAAEEELEDKPAEPALSLNKSRLSKVLAELKKHSPKSVLDLGCGEGKLLLRLAADKDYEKVAGLDISERALLKAKERLTRAFTTIPSKVEFYHGSLTYLDDRLNNFDAVAVVEVIEHLAPHFLETFSKLLFGRLKPRIVIVTTPNKEFNVNFPSLAHGRLRDRTHRFEWTRAEFRLFCENNAAANGYTLEISGIGNDCFQTGQPTQLAVFVRL